MDSGGRRKTARPRNSAESRGSDRGTVHCAARWRGEGSATRNHALGRDGDVQDTLLWGRRWALPLPATKTLYPILKLCFAGMQTACPRDCFLVVGDEIIEAAMSWRSRLFEFYAYKKLFAEYFKQGARWTAAPRPAMGDDTYRKVCALSLIKLTTLPIKKQMEQLHVFLREEKFSLGLKETLM